MKKRWFDLRLEEASQLVYEAKGILEDLLLELDNSVDQGGAT